MDDVDDDDDIEVFDGPCVVCGESVLGTSHVTLQVFGVYTADGYGLHFGRRDDEDDDDEDPQLHPVHIDVCARAYFDGILVDAKFRHRRGGDV